MFARRCMRGYFCSATNPGRALEVVDLLLSCAKRDVRSWPSWRLLTNQCLKQAQ
uniref:Uncharacterized protein n=1 Tax=Arundo donax TaxID=35708 RepID=A0A0A9GWE3_ARUDO